MMMVGGATAAADIQLFSEFMRARRMHALQQQ